MEENNKTIHHKIEAGNKYRIFKTTYNDKDFYKIQVSQTNYDKTKDKFYIGITFKKGVELSNETDIIIKEAYENMRKNPKDPYNPIVYLMVTDFEIVERQEQIEADAYSEFQDNLNENEMVDIDSNFLD